MPAGDTAGALALPLARLPRIALCGLICVVCQLLLELFELFSSHLSRKGRLAVPRVQLAGWCGCGGGGSSLHRRLCIGGERGTSTALRLSPVKHSSMLILHSGHGALSSRMAHPSQKPCQQLVRLRAAGCGGGEMKRRPAGEGLTRQRCVDISSASKQRRGCFNDEEAHSEGEGGDAQRRIRGRRLWPLLSQMPDC